MGKCFNVKQKEWRRQIAGRKRTQHGDPVTGKLKRKNLPLSVSGKRKRKLEKKQRRDRKELAEKGILAMEIVEMASADNPSSSQGASVKTSKQFHMKKSLKLKANKRKHKGKGKTNPASGAVGGTAAVDAMVVE